jgi:tetratricopeptide (TPR) repeat protein
VRADEALREIRAAVDLDPVSLIIHSDYALDLLMLRRYGEALRECSRTLELDPNFATAHWYLGAVYTRLGRHEEAVAELNTGARATFGDNATNSKLALTYAHWGKPDRALELAAAIRKSSTDTPDAACSQAAIYASIGRGDEAIRRLEEAFRGHAGCIVWLKASYEFDGMRSDPRFTDIMRRAGLP